MKKLIYFILFCTFNVFNVSSTFGQNFVYKPKNPAFGGDTFNYQWLLSSAQTQDLLEDPDIIPFGSSGSTIDNFAESLNRQLLSQLSRSLISNQFGENGLEDGTYIIGDFQIDVSSTFEGLLINIIDNAAGDQTEIIIPFY